ncbi:hypothetical protein H0H92_011963 [Tricholoma furcatifolium]|nr:hypothetical protein H0H92_011963 [Tricholoma furcatifolium]
MYQTALITANPTNTTLAGVTTRQWTRRRTHRHPINRNDRRHREQHDLERDPRQRKHIDAPPPPPKPKPRPFHRPAPVAPEYENRDGHGVARAEADDRDADEGVEGCAGAEVDEPQEELHGRREEVRVEGDGGGGGGGGGGEGAGAGAGAGGPRDASEEGVERDRFVPREGPGCARGGAADRYGAEDANAED